jgi:hypothetical protein
MKKLFTLVTLFVSLTALSQSSGTIKGQLKDTSFRQSLLGATISVMDKDSVLLSYGLSKADGNFQVNSIPFGTVLVLISLQKFDAVYKSVTISKENPVVDVGTIMLTVAPKDLGNVTVTSAPVAIKGDTTEFNAGSFKTKPNASAEDLLKKLPGVQVEKDGTVKAQGENVTKVLVDGKKFFGNDPKLATKNLPADVIDKVQVYDAQSDQSTFSGFDDGNREKTINIITKKDRRKGYFGKASVGGGDNERYAASLSANRFNGNQQLSVIAQANNTNQQNFSIQDILGVMGGSGMFGGGGGGGMQMVTMVSGGGRGGGAMSNIGNFFGGTQSGIARTIAGGLNYNDVWSKNTSVSGSYFYNNMNVANNKETFRETFVGDSSIFSRNNQISTNKNQNHRFSFEIDQKIDSFNSILIRPSFSYQENNSYSENTSSVFGKSSRVNDQQTNNRSDNTGYNFNNSVLLRHKFQKKGRTLSLNFTQALNNTSTTRHNLSYINNYFGPFSKKDTTDQLSDLERDGKTYGANLSYTEPIDRKSLIELSYNYNNNKNNSDQQSMKYNAGTGKYDLADNVLTNNFENTNISNRVGVNYRRQISKEWNYIVGLGVQHSELTSDNKTKNRYVTQSFDNFTPTISLQYSKNRAKNLRINYRGNTRQPSITQLQDVLDWNTSNRLYISRGNPSLKQEFAHTFNIFYTKFDIFTFRNFFASLNGSFTANKISNSIITNQSQFPYALINNGVDTLYRGGQFTAPVNTNGAFNIAGFVNVGFPVKKVKGNLNLTSTIAATRDVNLTKEVSDANFQESYTNNYILAERVSLTMNLKERFDLNFSSSSTYTIAKYSLQPQLDANYFTQLFSIEPTYSSKGGWIFGVDFDYNIYTGQSQGYNQSVPLLNASIAKQLFKNKAGELKISAYDLLNQNQSITRTVQENYVEDVNTQVLKRYFMLSFTYNLRKFGKNAMPGFFNMFRGAMPGGGQIRVN